MSGWGSAQGCFCVLVGGESIVRGECNWRRKERCEVIVCYGRIWLAKRKKLKILWSTIIKEAEITLSFRYLSADSVGSMRPPFSPLFLTAKCRCAERTTHTEISFRHLTFDLLTSALCFPLNRCTQTEEAGCSPSYYGSRLLFLFFVLRLRSDVRTGNVCFPRWIFLSGSQLVSWQGCGVWRCCS